MKINFIATHRAAAKVNAIKMFEASCEFVYRQGVLGAMQGSQKDTDLTT